MRRLDACAMVVQWLRLCISNAEDMSSIPGWQTKIPQAGQEKS